MPQSGTSNFAAHCQETSKKGENLHYLIIFGPFWLRRKKNFFAVDSISKLLNQNNKTSLLTQRFDPRQKGTGVWGWDFSGIRNPKSRDFRRHTNNKVSQK